MHFIVRVFTVKTVVTGREFIQKTLNFKPE